MNYLWLFSIGFVLTSVWLIATGIWCIARRKPLLHPAKYNFWMLVLVFSPNMMMAFTWSFSEYADSYTHFLTILSLVTYAVTLTYFWKVLGGYTVLGVSDESFQDALRYALRKLDLPFEESLSRIKLTTLKDADLQVSVQSWVGTAQFKFKQSQHNSTLDKIANAMREYFASSSSQVNNATSIFNVATGVLLLASVIFMSVLINTP